MEWLLQNWIWVLLFAGFIAMHMFGHGGHGGHGKHGNGHSEPEPTSKDSVQRGPEKGPGHQH